MNRPIKLAAALILMLFMAPVLAQEVVNLEKHPGYIDLEAIRIPNNAGKVTDIVLGPELLRIASLFGGSEETEDLSKSISGLLSIRVKSFEIERMRDLEKLEPIINRIQDKLLRDQWSHLVRVRDGENFTNLSIRYVEGKPVGLVLMSYEELEGVVTFINVVGGIRLEDISKFHLNIRGSALDSLRRAFEK